MRIRFAKNVYFFISSFIYYYTNKNLITQKSKKKKITSFAGTRNSKANVFHTSMFSKYLLFLLINVPGVWQSFLLYPMVKLNFTLYSSSFEKLIYPN